MAFNHHSNDVTAEALTVARQEAPVEGGGGALTRTRGADGRPTVLSICHVLVEETAGVRVFCSFDVDHCCAVGSWEDAITRARSFGGVC